ncbi:ABC transporter substrate-binding protein [Peribacillus muralis]|uniref:ABC transporter substrate-binding protein n=1 Tax=Peribacillus muralis TaxID=264697 RepID=UPI001F4E857C|nr:ABC transporter substrate-binding protein [Peribacillus muralis]MCK1994958.1 ABC transporter substrate-binding protein [Peribacillus muralis]MCK2015496.1 ABC transporter substrate-binding protein [Peribacillus muralis]
MYNVISKKKMLQLLGAGLLAISLAACGDEEAKDNQSSTNKTNQTSNKDNKEEVKTRTLTDAMGHKVTIPAKPERVIASYLEDNLVTLGVKPVAQWSVKDGASIQGYLQEDLDGIPTIPHDLPFEAVQKMKPDLIIMDSASMVEGGKYEQYNKIAPTYVIGTEVNNDWRDELKRVGEVFGKEDEAKKALDNYEAKAAEAKKTLEKETDNPSVAAVWLVGGKFFVVSDNLSSGSVMYDDLGLKEPGVVKEISASATGNWSAISLEKLVEMDADHLFLINSDTSTGSKALNEALWKSIPAVKSGNVHEFSADESWLYTGAVANEQIIDNVLKSLVK